MAGAAGTDAAAGQALQHCQPRRARKTGGGIVQVRALPLHAAAATHRHAGHVLDARQRLRLRLRAAIQLEAQVLTAAPLPPDQQQLAAAVLHVKPCAAGGGDGAAAIVQRKAASAQRRLATVCRVGAMKLLGPLQRPPALQPAPAVCRRAAQHPLIARPPRCRLKRPPAARQPPPAAPPPGIPGSKPAAGPSLW